MSTPAIAFAGATKRFGAAVAIDRAEFAIPERQLWCVVAPRRGGKTTLIRLIAGLLHPDEGTIRVFGSDTVQSTGDVQAHIGYAPHEPGIYEDLTVGENIELHADLRAVPASLLPTRLNDVLGLTGLGEFRSKKAVVLARGEKRGLAIACALVGSPRLLLLDEPANGLDPASRRTILRLLRDLVDQGTSVLWTTAIADEAEASDGILLLNEGRVVAAGRPDEFLARLQGRLRVVRVAPGDRYIAARQLSAAPGVRHIDIRRTSLKLLTDAADRSFPWPIAEEIQAAAPRLEDAVLDSLSGGTATLPLLAPPPRPWAYATDTCPALQVAKLTKVERGRRLADVVELDVRRGEITGLMGPNGSGKSLMLRLLSGISRPTHGTIAICGVDLMADRYAALERLGYVSPPYPDLNPVQNLQFAASARRLSRARRNDRVQQLLSEFGLQPVAKMRSGALRMALQWRLALAAALIRQPGLLLVDEPGADLDPSTHRLFWSDLVAIAAQGVGVLVASHMAEDADRCDRVFSIRHGQVTAAGISPPGDGLE